jgi:hypothetical protein
MKAAQAMGKKRWHGFVESLSRRMEAGPKLRDEVELGKSDASIS